MNWPPCPECRGTNIGLAWATHEQAQLFCRSCQWAWLVDLENETEDFSDLPEPGTPYQQDLEETTEEARG